MSHGTELHDEPKNWGIELLILALALSLLIISLILKSNGEITSKIGWVTFVVLVFVTGIVRNNTNSISCVELFGSYYPIQFKGLSWFPFQGIVGTKNSVSVAERDITFLITLPCKADNELPGDLKSSPLVNGKLRALVTLTGNIRSKTVNAFRVLLQEGDTVEEKQQQLEHFFTHLVDSSLRDDIAGLSVYEIMMDVDNKLRNLLNEKIINEIQTFHPGYEYGDNVIAEYGQEIIEIIIADVTLEKATEEAFTQIFLSRLKGAQQKIEAQNVADNLQIVIKDFKDLGVDLNNLINFYAASTGGLKREEKILTVNAQTLATLVKTLEKIFSKK